VAGVIAARRLNVPLVCSYHTDVPAYARSYHLGWMTPVIWKVIKELHRPAAVNVVTSDAAGDQLRSIGLGKEADGYGEIRVWPGGAELAYSAPDTSEEVAVREAHPEGEITAVYVGRVADEKGLENLVPLADTPGMPLVIVGDGPAMAETKKLFAGKPVTFTGFLRGQPLVDAYHEADVFVFPSSTDTLGLVLLEALASGLPVVAAAAPPSRELLGDNPAARLFPIGQPEAIPGLVKDLLGSMPRDELRKKAMETAAGNSWEASTAALVRCYELAEQHSAERSERPPRRGLRAQLARFGLIGALNAIIDLGVFNILVTLFPRPGSAALASFNTLAVVLALLNSYWWNSRWTFRQLGVSKTVSQRWQSRSLFAIQGLLNVAINDAVVVGAAGLFHTVGVLPAVVQDNLSKLTAMFTATLISFAAMRWVVFRHRGAPGAMSQTGETGAPKTRTPQPRAVSGGRGAQISQASQLRGEMSWSASAGPQDPLA
ncbi:MAG: glycosyltransferase, partial [Acidimicrobiales bacterium]